MFIPLITLHILPALSKLIVVGSELLDLGQFLKSLRQRSQISRKKI
jgi:hypothetical protein